MSFRRYVSINRIARARWAAIILAALAPTVETGPLNLNEVDFLRQVVEA